MKTISNRYIKQFLLCTKLLSQCNNLKLIVPTKGGTYLIIIPAFLYLPSYTCLIPPALSYLPYFTCLIPPALSHLPFYTCLITPALSYLPYHTCLITPTLLYLPYFTCLVIPTKGGKEAGSRSIEESFLARGCCAIKTIFMLLQLFSTNSPFRYFL